MSSPLIEYVFDEAGVLVTSNVLPPPVVHPEPIAVLVDALLQKEVIAPAEAEAILQPSAAAVDIDEEE